MGDEALERSAAPSLETLGVHVEALAAEVATLRESIVTAAEWDAEARRVRQLTLDATLASVQLWLRALVGVIVVLLVLVIWLVVQVGPRG